MKVRIVKRFPRGAPITEKIPNEWICTMPMLPEVGARMVFLDIENPDKGVITSPVERVELASTGWRVITANSGYRITELREDA